MYLKMSYLKKGEKEFTKETLIPCFSHFHGETIKSIKEKYSAIRFALKYMGNTSDQLCLRYLVAKLNLFGFKIDLQDNYVTICDLDDYPHMQMFILICYILRYPMENWGEEDYRKVVPEKILECNTIEDLIKYLMSLKRTSHTIASTYRQYFSDYLKSDYKISLGMFMDTAIRRRKDGGCRVSETMALILEKLHNAKTI